MANPLYNEINKDNNNGVMDQFRSFTQNPIQFLLQKNINIPEQFSNDPHGAVQYLLNNGQMSQDTFNKLRNTARKMGVNI